jgi:hypothetical protein
MSLNVLFIAPRGETAAITNYWDPSLTAAIPQRYIAITSAFLEATGALPDPWYQGAKARNIVMPTLYKAWVTFFRKYAAIVSGIGGIDEVLNCKGRVTQRKTREYTRQDVYINT